MFDPKQLDDLARRLSDVLPEGLKSVREDMEKNFRAILQSTFSQMDLVSREEFEVQTALLQRTRKQLEALEEQVRELEQKLGD
ncbi:MAG: ubiquinone biosynthesis accessory factor UbiK [Methylohalobius sp. ZOD2]|uniref:ubiquinone biosynthesis accessory factor UbiK n=1 Tax=Methylohalobius crimeensis TaxID=244365 RepID=UPI00040DAEAE|nr:accessory factor UbiK family protein [Methylohalobius crimeensis]